MGNMEVIKYLGQGGLRSLSASSFRNKIYHDCVKFVSPRMY